MAIRYFTLLLCLVLLGKYAISQTDSSHLKWDILPNTHLVKLFTADTRAHRLSLHKPWGNNGYVGSMGGIFPVAKIYNNQRAFQVSVASTVYTTLQRWVNRGILVNIDFFVDIYGDYKINNNWAIRGAIGHTSQHLSDDAMIAGNMPINYTRDYGQLFGIYNTKHFSCHAGITLNTNLKTTKDYGVVLMPQFGFEHSPINWKTNSSLYYAADIKFRGEHNYGTIQNIQVGYKYNKSLQHTFRFCVNYTSGYEERGQFYTQKRNFMQTGVYFDF